MSAEDEADFEGLLLYLREHRGFDFGSYKRTTLNRRVHRRMDEVGVVSYSAYRAYLDAEPGEFQLLFNTILINVTAFFRDSAAWTYLASDALPMMLAGKAPGDAIRVWSAGCATGEEAYSAAITLAELLGVEAFCSRVKIYATDIDDEALAKARDGFSAREVERLRGPLVERYLEVQSGRYRLRQDMRSRVVFGRHDLVQDAPISRVDFLLCRNTLMYFTAEAQGRMLARLHYALQPAGVLFLGKAEMLLTHTDLFKPENLKHRVFRKVESPDRRGRIVLLARSVPRPRRVSTDKDKGKGKGEGVSDLAADLAPVGQVTVSSDGVLLMVNQAARRMFGVGPEDIGRPLRDLELSYRPLELRSRIEEAVESRDFVEVLGVQSRDPQGRERLLDVRISPLVNTQGGVDGTTVSFTDVTGYMELRVELERSRHDLEAAYQELQSVNEELQTTNEELQSTVEELETTNEELQSTNEELETMNEELESTNNELNTTNADLEVNSADLATTRQFTDSVLTSLRLAVVAIDDGLVVRMWNRQSEDLWGLRAEEATGEAFFGLDIGLPLKELRPAVKAVLAGSVGFEEVIVEATNRRGRAIRCRVVITPVAGVGGGAGTGVALLVEDLGPG